MDSGKGRQMIAQVKALAKKGIKNINIIILSLYLFIVWMSYLFLNYYQKVDGPGFLAYLVGVLVFIAFITCKIINKLSTVKLIKTGEMHSRDKIIIFSIFSLICFGILMLWYIAVYPGSFSYDSYYQYHQATTGAYNDWHPAWHTVVFFTFPLMLTGKVSSIVLFQIIYFSLVMGYMCLFISKYANVKWAAAAMAYIMLNPYTGNILMYPWKDVGFAIAGFLSMIMSAELFFSKGKGGKWWYTCILGLVLANTTIFRHNAVLYTAVLIVALLINITRKQAVLLLCSFFLTLFTIKVPVYKSLGVVTDVGARVTETVGLPMTVMGNVVKEAPWAVDAELAEFMYSLASQEEWESGTFGMLKPQINNAAIEEAGHIKILSLMFRCFQRASEASLRGFVELTDMVYSIEGEIDRIDCYPVGANDYGIESAANWQMLFFLQNYVKIIYSTIFRYPFYIGASMVFMLFAVFSKCSLGKWEDWKKIFLCLPIFSYNFGTMLLLTGSDSRFFYISFLVCPIVVTIMFVSRKESDHGE